MTHVFMVLVDTVADLCLKAWLVHIVEFNAYRSSDTLYDTHGDSCGRGIMCLTFYWMILILFGLTVEIYLCGRFFSLVMVDSK